MLHKILLKNSCLAIKKGENLFLCKKIVGNMAYLVASFIFRNNVSCHL